MDFNNIIGSNWNEIKGKIRQKWGKLSDQDTEVWKGNFEELSGKIQRTYGLTKDQVETEFKGMTSGFTNSMENGADKLKTGVDHLNDRVADRGDRTDRDKVEKAG